MITNKHIIFFIAFFTFIGSCSWLLGVKELGDRLYWDDKIIVLTETDKYEGIGLCIIPPTVKKVKYDEKVVLISALNEKNIIKYWLIDKTMEAKEPNYIGEDTSYFGYYKYSNVSGPLDPIEFEQLKIQKDVKLKS